MDPLRSIIRRERVLRAAALIVLIAMALLAALLKFWPPTYVTDGRQIEGTVVRLGTEPAGEGYGGDLPILTVRLPDGSVRQVRGSWATAGRCKRGERVPLVQRGTALQIGLRGCA
jgi:hypothetical protein